MATGFRLSDKLNRDIGHVSKLWKVDGGFGGRFKPGSDYSKVEPLFDGYEEMLQGLSSATTQNAIQELAALEPRIISEEDGTVTSFYVAVVTKVPAGFMVTLVEADH